MISSYTSVVKEWSAEWQGALTVEPLGYVAYFDSDTGLAAFNAELMMLDQLLSSASQELNRLDETDEHTLRSPWLSFIDVWADDRHRYLLQMESMYPVRLFALHPLKSELHRMETLRLRIQESNETPGLLLDEMHRSLIARVKEWQPEPITDSRTYWSFSLDTIRPESGSLHACSAHEIEFFRRLLQQQHGHLVTYAGLLHDHHLLDDRAASLVEVLTLAIIGDRSWIQEGSALSRRLADLED